MIFRYVLAKIELLVDFIRCLKYTSTNRCPQEESRPLSFSLLRILSYFLALDNLYIVPDTIAAACRAKSRAKPAWLRRRANLCNDILLRAKSALGSGTFITTTTDDTDNFLQDK